MSARKDTPGAAADRRLVDVLTTVQSWCGRLPANGDKHVSRLRGGIKYAAYAAELLEK